MIENGIYSLLVGYNCEHGVDKGVLIVGVRKPGSRGTSIINAFQGKEAEELYLKLVTKAEEKK